MKKQFFLMIAVVMIAALALSACSNAVEEPPVTINLPAVSSGAEGAVGGVESTGESAAVPVGETYPVEQNAASLNSQTQADSTYPIGVALSDAEIESLVVENLKDQHTLDFLFSQDKTKAEWQQVLADHIQYGVTFTSEQMSQVIDWLMRK